MLEVAHNLFSVGL